MRLDYENMKSDAPWAYEEADHLDPVTTSEDTKEEVAYEEYDQADTDDAGGAEPTVETDVLEDDD